MGSLPVVKFSGRTHTYSACNWLAFDGRKARLSSKRSANGRRNVRMLEQHTLAGQPIKSRRLDLLVSRGAGNQEEGNKNQSLEFDSSPNLSTLTLHWLLRGKIVGL